MSATVLARLEELGANARRLACREINSHIAGEVSGLSGEAKLNFLANLKSLSSYCARTCGYSARVASVSARVQGALAPGASVFQGATRIPTPHVSVEVPAAAKVPAQEGPDILDASSVVDAIVEVIDEPVVSVPADAGGFLGRRVKDLYFHCILGEGAQAVVYGAYRPSGAELAVKVSKSGTLDMGRFTMTSQRLGVVQSTRILRPMDAFVLEGGFPAFPMRKMHGDLKTLARTHHDRVAAGNATQSSQAWERTVAKFILEMAQAVESMYASVDPRTGEPLRLLHRDVKPSNIAFVRSAGSPSDTDLGTAEFLLMDFDSMIREGDESEPAMTPLFASPQLLRGEASSHADDVYALGATMCAILTGHTPYWFRDPSVEASGSKNEDCLGKIAPYLHCDLPPVIPERRGTSFLGNIFGRFFSGVGQDSGPAYHRSLVRIIRKAIHPDLRQRYQRAADMADDLELALQKKRVSPKVDSSASGRRLSMELPEAPPTDRIGRAG